MLDNQYPPQRDQIVLEYLQGGVTYRQLQTKYGIARTTIHHWVQHHKGIVRDWAAEGQKRKSAKTKPASPPRQGVTPPPQPVGQANPLADELQQARLKIALLEEVIRIAQEEHKLTLPKKFTTKR
ncbi:hypothetical protein JYG30_19755 [Fibrella sp. USSR17]